MEGGERWKYIYIYKLETVWISSTLDSANTLSLKPFWSTGFVRIHEFAYKNADIHNNAYKNAVTCMHWRRERVFFGRRMRKFLLFLFLSLFLSNSTIPAAQIVMIDGEGDRLKMVR